MTTTEPPRLTAKQAKVLEFIRANAQCYSPTVREIAAGMGFRSPNAVTNHIKALESKGLIRRRPNIARGIEVLG